MFYIVDRMEEDYILELEIPDSYEIKQFHEKKWKYYKCKRL